MSYRGIPLSLILAMSLSATGVSCSDDPPDEGQDLGAVDVGDTAADADETDTGDIGDDSTIVLGECGEGGTLTVTSAEGGSLAFSTNDEVTYRLDVEAGSVASATDVNFACLPDSIVPDGFAIISQPVEIDFPGEFSRYARVRVPFDLDALPENTPPSSLRIFRTELNGGSVRSPVAINLQENMTRGFATFSTRFPGIYELSVADDAGDTYERDWAFRAITGVSMGCNGAMMIGLRNPEAFDIIGALGGPTDWTYLSHYIAEGGMGGFGPAPNFDDVGSFVPTEEFEHTQSYDEWWSPTGDGTGGTFDRNEYLSIFQDLSLAFGNLVSYSDVSPFLPAGLGVDELTRSTSERCPGGDGTTVIESGFFDDEFNPDGSLPVIMFCDGGSNQDRTLEFDRYCDLDFNGQPDDPNRGYYPGPESQRRPTTIAWAVDLDGDGQRDRGEPIIRNFHEPFDDFGSDGIASVAEAGYDAVANPDPSGDDYDYYRNAEGTEDNWLYDEGESYEDVGLDGVADTTQLSDDGYDWGEGNDQFDYNPHLTDLLQTRDPHHTVANLSDNDWDNLTIYMDGGIRDLFNFAVSTNQFSGQLQRTGQNVRIYDTFHGLANLDPVFDDYRFAEVPYDDVGDHVYVRYGNRDASEEDICLGDGKHVGTVPQIANRLLTLLGFITNRMPDGDYTQLEPPYPTPNGSFRFYSAALDAFEQYSIILPPGYEWSVCMDNQDNDDDGLTDGDDPDCEHGSDGSEGPGLGNPRCSDGIDNDEDGDVDFPADADCANADDNSEWPSDHPLRDGRFPVVYLLHGYGQTPDDLRATVVPFAGFMAGGTWQKVIVVYPDGFCGDNDIRQCNDGIDNDGDDLIDTADPDCENPLGRGEDGTDYRLCADGVDNDNDGLIDDADGGCISPEADDESECVKGNFYTNHAAWPDGSAPGPAFEDALFDLIEHIDETYRTRTPETTTELR